MLRIQDFTPPTDKRRNKPGRGVSNTILAALGLSGLVTGCTDVNLTLASDVKAQTLLSAIPTPTPTPTSVSIPPTGTTFMPSPTNTSSSASTSWPTPTPWPTPASWSPVVQPLPTLAPVPIVPAAPVIPGGSIPVSYSPPDGVDVFGNTILRWTYYGQLTPDEFFDIKIKPFGSNDSAFVDWSKSTEYQLRPWSGWTPGLYTWQIGIVKGHLEGTTKHFIADTGRDSKPFLIKWQPAGGGGGGGGGSTGSGGGGGGGGSSSGGS
jgi:uncharacterized membrane protein YgcG